MSLSPSSLGLPCHVEAMRDLICATVVSLSTTTVSSLVRASSPSCKDAGRCKNSLEAQSIVSTRAPRKTERSHLSWVGVKGAADDPEGPEGAEARTREGDAGEVSSRCAALPACKAKASSGWGSAMVDGKRCYVTGGSGVDGEALALAPA